MREDDGKQLKIYMNSLTNMLKFIFLTTVFLGSFIRLVGYKQIIIFLNLFRCTFFFDKRIFCDFFGTHK